MNPSPRRSPDFPRAQLFNAAKPLQHVSSTGGGGDQESSGSAARPQCIAPFSSAFLVRPSKTNTTAKMAEQPSNRKLVKGYAISTAVGGFYGATNTIVGHPFDTVKTKMQAQSGFGGTSSMSTARMIHASNGWRGFYHGCIPPLWGSVVYRSTQFAVYDTVVAKLAAYPAMRSRVLPGSDLEARVVVAGFTGASARTLLESPIEYAKVQGQTGQVWRMADVYRGAGLQWARTAPMMTFWFCAMDACKRNGLTSSPLGQFLCSGGAALVGFWIVWPFETLKNQAQAGIGGSMLDKVRNMPGGPLGLYRGIVPGSISVFSRNGAAMIVLSKLNQKIDEWGLRE